MHRVREFFAELIGKLFRWFISWGIVVGAVSTGWFALNTNPHRLPQGTEWGLIILLTVIAAMLGFVSALAWEMTHIGAIIKFARNRSKHPVAETQEMPAQHTEHS